MATMSTPRYLLFFAWVGATGCGYGVNSSTPAPPLAAPSIVQPPSNQSVPMGLTATYAVVASGEFMQYQWTKNGVDVPGATGSSYITPPTTFADTGSIFSVTVSNSAGTATSGASLTVTARAPAAGDLRFQQVDAASTVNGYGSGTQITALMLASRSAEGYASSLGTPLWVGGTGNCTTTIVQNEPSCAWDFAPIALSATQAALGLVAGYASDVYSNVQYDLADPNWPNLAIGSSPAAPGSVATSLDLEPANQLFAVSWIQAPADALSTFSWVKNTVAPDGLQAAASLEGAHSRVITAISNENGAITYLSYGWSADTSTVYELKVSTAPPAAAASAAAALAAEGYIITATGLADSAGDVVLVGTRVQGDSMGRPFIAAQGSNVDLMMQNGYATVGVIVDSSQSDADTYLGER